ncbi:MAG: hypothetical protein HRU38_25710 [Saccharospirillaceae bacterium]|nr:hypothetical protein [Saccharospirillaceae bacterium]
MGIQNPSETSEFEFKASNDITEELTSMIYRQDDVLSNLDKDKVAFKKKELKMSKESRFQATYKEIYESTDDVQKKKAL